MSEFSGIHVGENLSQISPKTTDGEICGLLHRIVLEERRYKTWSKVLDNLFHEQDKQQG